MPKKNNPQVFVLGWDAADWKFITPLLDDGKLPALQRVIDAGVMGNIATIDPPLSPILWTSIATGKYGDEHGVLNFVEPSAETGKRIPISVLSRKVRAIWNILTHEGFKTHLIGWWPSYPAEPINGINVSNHFPDVNSQDSFPVWDLSESHIHPKEMFEELKELRIHPIELSWNHIAPFVPTATKEHIENPKNHELLNAIIMMLARCSSFHNVATHVLATQEWNFIGLYLDAIDKASHYFMKYHPPQQKHISDEDYALFKDVMTGFYIYHDMMLDRLLQLMKDDAYLMILSDHGFYSDHRRLETLPNDSMAPAFEHSKFGIFCLKGPGIKADERVYGSSLIDITPTLLHLFGLPVGKDMPGKVLTQSFIEPQEIKYIDTWEFKDDKNWGELDDSIKIDVWSAQEALQQLIALGYIEEMDESDEKILDQIQTENAFHSAQIKVSTGRQQEAIADLEELHAKKPDNIKFVGTLLSTHLAIGNTTEARKYLTKMREKLGTENTPQLDFLEGRVLFQEIQPRKALVFLEKAANHEVANAGFYQTLGRLFLVSKEWKKAQKVFLKAISLDTENAAAYHGLCVAYMRQKKHNDAIEAGLNAVAIKHMFPTAHYHLGEALLNAKMYDHAASAFEMALTQEPGFGLARKYLIQIYTDHVINEERKKLHQEILNNNMRPQMTIVSGLPRSGTSMMMQMLKAGGADLLVDDIRKNDENNPKGYMEYEPVKKLLTDNSWLKDQNGKTIKIILQLLTALDMSCDYKIIMMDRDLEEILSSQQKMLGKKTETLNQTLLTTFEQQKEKINNWLVGKPNIQVLHVKYKDVIADPANEAQRINIFLSDTLDESKMLEAVDKQLYRNKK